ncbi:MAG: 50S ribosomal protein L32 [Candidatus Muirbacterium halophilum]|jgi:large subunit ribosomal protein L32|nr:50S ribosomal protein L32 [Candidatus Muirbacterium halophilum]MCK9477037.1 50S ribosomal protein L32 [Candidatus Muirbacterium halophilum]
MPNPVSRHSKSRRDKRKANWKAYIPANFAKCSNPDCGQPVLPHRVCKACGNYKGNSVIKVKE